MTDSTASLPRHLIERFRISVVPLTVQFGSRSYRDGVDVSQKEFYQLLEGEAVPTTSQPSPADFVKVYKELAHEADSIISIHISSTLSGTIQVADMVKSSLKDQDISLVDSGTTSLGLGLLVLRAAKAAEEGMAKSEILRMLQELISRVTLWVYVPSLRYLQKSGRVHRGQALLASLLSIKLIVRMKEGTVELVDRVRGKAAAINALLERVWQEAANRAPQLAVGHVNAEGEAYSLAKRVAEKFSCPEDSIMVSDAGATIAAHVGPGSLGIIALY